MSLVREEQEEKQRDPHQLGEVILRIFLFVFIYFLYIILIIYLHTSFEASLPLEFAFVHQSPTHKLNVTWGGLTLLELLDG